MCVVVCAFLVANQITFISLHNVGITKTVPPAAAKTIPSSLFSPETSSGPFISVSNSGARVNR